MDCRVLLQEFEDLNNNPIVVYNQLSYSQQTASGVKQVPYRLSNKGSQSSGIQVAKQERSDKLLCDKQNRLANQLAQSSHIKTEAILVREQIKHFNRQGKLTIKKRSLNLDIQKQRFSLSKSGLQSDFKESTEEIQKDIKPENGFADDAKPFRREDLHLDQPAIRIRTKRTGGDRNKDSRLQKGLFSHELNKRSPSPLVDKCFSQKIRQFKSKNLFNDFNRPATNMDSTLTKIYSQFVQWDARNIEAKAIQRYKQDRIRDSQLSNKESEISKQEKLQSIRNNATMLQQDQLINIQSSLNQQELKNLKEEEQSKSLKRKIQRRKLNLSVEGHDQQVNEICRRVRLKNQASPKINDSSNAMIFTQVQSPIARYANISKQWSHAPLSPTEQRSKINLQKPVSAIRPLFEAKSSLQTPKAQQPDLLNASLQFKKDSIGKKLANNKGGYMMEQYLTSSQRKLVLHQIYNQRSMTAQESSRLRARTSQK